MFEKVNPSHPDKIADRIAGALVDLAYDKSDNPRIAVEVLIGHGECFIIAETSVHFTNKEIADIVVRITQQAIMVKYLEVPQDKNLAENQRNGLKCGDNGIFKGIPTSHEEAQGRALAEQIFNMYHSDGKYIIDGDKVIICQSNADEQALQDIFPTAIINPLGHWTGGLDVDTGATNRKLGSDMGRAVTGGGLHGKDLSKADVSVNIYAHLKAQAEGKPVEISCAIGDDMIDGLPYGKVVNIAKRYIQSKGGFEKFAEWGII